MFVLSVLAGLLPLTMAAQDDDLYFVPKKQVNSSTSSMTKSTDRQNDAYYVGSSRDIDEYNRHGEYRHYQNVGTDSLGDDVIEFDAVAGTYPSDDNQSSAEGRYSDDDYVNTRSMSRFDGYVGLGYYPWYTCDPWYYDSWYYDPWFYGYRPWYGWYGYYSPWRYRWYSPYYWYHPSPVFVASRGNAGYGTSRITRHGRSGYVSGGFSGYRGNSTSNGAKGSYSRNSNIRNSRYSSSRDFDYNRSSSSNHSSSSNRPSTNSNNSGFNRSSSSFGGSFGGSRSSGGGFGGGSHGGGRSGGGFGGRR